MHVLPREINAKQSGSLWHPSRVIVAKNSLGKYPAPELDNRLKLGLPLLLLMQDLRRNASLTGMKMYFHGTEPYNDMIIFRV